MGKKGDLRDFERGMVVGDRRAGLSISKTADLLGFSHTTISRVNREWSEKEKISYSSRRPHRVPLLSAKNRKRRLQFAQVQQNWTIEDWKNVVWSDESWFLLWHSDGRVRIWRKEHESMDSSCLVLTVQAAGGGLMVWGIIFSWHILGSLVPIKRHSLPEYCCWPCPSLYDYSVPIFWCTSSRIMHHVTKLKSSQTGFLNMTMSSLYSNVLHSHQISIQ